MLVATTVIEVGVDVPNASTMVVLDADRFGVSQLHQLRGRVGRGQYAGVCLLVTHAEAETVSRERVDAVAATDDGFELAQVDLELRREGDVLGERQSGGRSSLTLLRVVQHGDVIIDAREEAERSSSATRTSAAARRCGRPGTATGRVRRGVPRQELSTRRSSTEPDGAAAGQDRAGMVACMTKIAVVPGSFDPVTLGHLDVIARAAELFDEVHVLVVHNPDKKAALFDAGDRVRLIQESLTEVGVPGTVVVGEWSAGLLVDYCRQVGAKVLVKGVRSARTWRTRPRWRS